MKGDEEKPSKISKEKHEKEQVNKISEIKLPKFLRAFAEVPCHCKKCNADVSVSLSDCKCPGCGEKEHLEVKDRPY